MSRLNRYCRGCEIETNQQFCPECGSITYPIVAKSIEEKIKLKPFEIGWEDMCNDLKKEKTFITTGGRKTFTAWYPGGEKITYRKSTNETCNLQKKEFRTAFNTLAETGVLDSTVPYHYTKHGSYYPPLIK
jgi:hypothetical protein